MTLEMLRKRKKMSLRAVGRRMGMTHQNVMRLERTGSAPIDTLEAYAAAIETDFPTVHAASKEMRSRTTVSA